MSNIDWKPWLEADERIVWQGRKKDLKTALGALGVMALFLVLPYFNDGSPQVQLAVAASPWIAAFAGISLVTMAVLRNDYAVTNRRALHLSRAPWRKPKLQSVSLAEVDVVKYPKTPLMFVHRRTGKPVIQMWLGQQEAADVMSMIKGGRL